MSSRKNNNFTEAIVNTDILDKPTDWIKASLHSKDVFTEEGLKTWTEDSGYSFMEEK